MEQRDLLRDQIEQLGKVLAKVISDFLKLKSAGNFADAISYSKANLKNELDLDVDLILTLDEFELKNHFAERKLNESQIESLALYLEELGDLEESEISFEKAIELLKIADEVSKTISFERMERIQILNRKINLKRKKGKTNVN